MTKVVNKCPNNCLFTISVNNDSSDGERKKRAVGLWVFDREFDSSAENRQKYIENENVWRKKRSNVPSDIGLKTYYYCTAVSKKKSPEECPAGIYTVDSNIAVKYSVYRNGVDHVHDKDGQILSKKPVTVRIDLMDKVKEYLALNARPRVISEKLRNDQNIEKPSESQIIYKI